MSAPPTAGIILAAGKGTRMKSDLPKALHEVAGLPMVRLIADAVRAAGVERPIVVVGHRGDLVRASLGDAQFEFVEQADQKGTGHAAMMAMPLLAGFDGPVLVVPGDAPLITSETLARLVEDMGSQSAQAAMATFVTVEPQGYGRIVRGADGSVEAIVEDRDATPEQRKILEVNPAVYCFQAGALRETLPTLRNDNSQGEYYLTDVVSAIRQSGGKVYATVFDDPDEFMGVNDRWQLAEASRVMRLRLLRSHAVNGVTIVDPSSTYIGADVVIEPDVILQPMTTVSGKTRIAAGSMVGPNSWVKDSVIGANCQVFMSHVDQVVMEDGSRCGPFSNLRPGTKLGPDVKIGNFVEIKNSQIGSSTAVSHLSYIGDATVGDSTNIGAGTITCNYDGFEKNRTEIGSRAFIGSNSTIIAPRSIGDGAIVAAGSVVTMDVPGDALAIGRSKQENKEEWASLWRERKQARHEPSKT
jgi:bifunctional UDP-N-acetylglucosamine pyrophosphorylase/glucosamine-1-phosphate N-acetyltransferase